MYMQWNITQPQKKRNFPPAASMLPQRGKHLEGITLSEISQTEKDKFSMISLICEIQKTK